MQEHLQLESILILFVTFYLVRISCMLYTSIHLKVSTSCHGYYRHLVDLWVVNGIHLPLSYRPNMRITIVIGDYYNCKCVMNIVMQGVCDVNKPFWDVCISQPSGVHDGRHMRFSSLYKQFRNQRDFSKTYIEGSRCGGFVFYLRELYLSYQALFDKKLQVQEWYRMNKIKFDFAMNA